MKFGADIYVDEVYKAFDEMGENAVVFARNEIREQIKVLKKELKAVTPRNKERQITLKQEIKATGDKREKRALKNSTMLSSIYSKVKIDKRGGFIRSVLAYRAAHAYFHNYNPKSPYFNFLTRFYEERRERSQNAVIDAIVKGIPTAKQQYRASRVGKRKSSKK